MQIKRIAVRGIALLALALACPAQDKVQRVLRITIQPSRLADWTSAVQEYNAIRQKAGFPQPVYVWQSLSGPSQYVLVQFFGSYADALATGAPNSFKDQAAALTAVLNRLNSSSVVTERHFAERMPEFSLPRSAAPPDMISVARSWVKPGKMDALLALVKSDLFPAVKASGQKSFSFYRMRYGGSRNEVYSSSGIDNAANLDATSPLVKAMGEQGFQSFLAKYGELVERNEWNLYRFRKDLSYMPAAGK